MKHNIGLLLTLVVAFYALPAQAEFAMSEMILDFSEKKPRQKDIEILSHSKETQYIATETYIVENANSENEKRTLVKDPTKSGLMITPNKMVLSAGARKTMRFLLLEPPSDKEKIYRVAVKPVIQGVEAPGKGLALKVLVGYEALVIVRPVNAKIELAVERKGNSITITNNGNTNANIQSGRQCDAIGEDCKPINVGRIYAGQTWTTTLPFMDREVKLQVWDGTTMQSLTY